MSNQLHFDGAKVLVEAVNVTKSFRDADTVRNVIDNVSLEIRENEFVSIMGPSGSGKTTLLHLLSTIEAPSSGNVFISGQNIGTLSRKELATLRRQQIGIVFQRLNLVPSLTAIENVALPLELDGVSGREARRQATASLETVGLETIGRRLPDQLSGGEQQRVAIARAITGERRIIFADEPTGALDTLSGDSIISLLAELQTTHHMTVVLVTHEPRFASWADRVVFVRNGSLVSSTESLLDEPLVAGSRT